MVFRSKYDWWIALILLGSVSLQIGIAVSLFRDGEHHVLGLVVLGVAFLVSSLLFSTYYKIHEGQLKIHCGPLRMAVPLSDIVEIAPTRSPASSPAMSLDRLRINYKRNGKQRTVLVSPKDRLGFLRQISLEVPKLKLDGETLKRR